MSEYENFYSRASCEARLDQVRYLLDISNFYSRASCEARHSGSVPARLNLHISTHAPHARRGRKI